MDVVPIGVGRSGAELVEGLLGYQDSTDTAFLRLPLAVGIEYGDLDGIDRVPAVNRMLPADMDEVGEEAEDVDLSKRVPELARRLDTLSREEIDAFLVAVAFDGSAAGDWARDLATVVHEAFGRPTVGLAMLRDPPEAPMTTDRIAEQLEGFAAAVDRTIVYDLAAATGPDDADEPFQRMIYRLGLLLSVDAVNPEASEAGRVVQPDEVLEALSGGGFVSIGYAADRQTDRRATGFIEQIWQPALGANETEPLTERTVDLLRQAVTDGLSTPCDLVSASTSLLLLGGPPAFLEAVDLEAVSGWLAERTQTEPRLGVYPFRNTEYVAAVVVVGGLPAVPAVQRYRDRHEAVERDVDPHDVGDAAPGRAAGDPTRPAETDEQPTHEEPAPRERPSTVAVPRPFDEVLDDLDGPTIDALERGALEHLLDEVVDPDGERFAWLWDERLDDLLVGDDGLTPGGRLYVRGLVAGVHTALDDLRAPTAEEAEGDPAEFERIVARRERELARRLLDRRDTDEH